MAKQAINKMTYGSLTKAFERTSRDTIKVKGFFTSDARDETGDVITRTATERAIPKYRQWGNIRLMHQPIPVAKVTKIGKEDGLDWNEVEIEVVDPNAIRMIEFGLLSALSVGILVDFDDVDFLQDGGLIINEYQLAEISLVDHPANYDAKLKDLVLDHDARMYAMQFGLDALREQFGGKDMPKKKALEEKQEEIVAEKELEESVEEIVTEEKENIEKSVEIEENEIEASESELSVESEIVSEEEVVEEEVLEEEVAEIEVEKEISQEESTEDIVEEEILEDKSIDSDKIYEMLIELKASFETFKKSMEVVNKGSEDEQKVDEPDEDKKRLKVLEEQNADLQKKLDEYLINEDKVAEQKGFVQETTEADSVKKELDQAEEIKIKTIKDALKARFSA